MTPQSVLVAEAEDHLLDVGEELVSLIVRIFELRVDSVAERQIGVAVEFGSVIQVPHEGGQPTELTAKRLISSALEIPLLWSDQRAFLRLGT